MVGDEDADVTVFQFPHDKLDILHGDGIDTGKRLVEHDELRFDGQTTGNLRPSALTARQLITLVLAHLFQTEVCDEALQDLYLFFAGFTRHLQYGEDIVLHAHLTEHRGFLCQIADAGTGTFIDGVGGHLMVAEIDMAAVGQHQTCRHIERCGLAGTVGAEKSHYLTLLHIEGDVVDHCALTIALHQSFCA